MASKKPGRRRVLQDHHRRGKVYVPPFVAGLGDYPNVRGHTWHDDVSPEFMWIALLYLAARERSAELAQEVVRAVRSLRGIKRAQTFAATSAWSALSPASSRTIRARLRKDGHLAELTEALAPLVWLYPECPMAPVFRAGRKKPTSEQRDAYLERMRQAAMLLLIRRTRDAALIQGIAVFAAVAGGGMSPRGLDLQNLPRLMEYPHTPESRRMEQTVRMTASMLALTCDGGNVWRSYFWRRGYALSECHLARDRFHAGADDGAAMAEAIVAAFENLSAELETEFAEAWAHCPVDLSAPHQSQVIGGLLARQVRYVRHLLITPRLLLDELGQPLLRSMVESAMTLAWLVRKGQAEDYARFVEFGLGQEKLALEHLRADVSESCAYLAGRRKSELSARSEWLESQRFSALLSVDVSTGWTQMSLRELAEQAGVLDLHNRIYGPTSAQVHGSWNAVGRTALRYCLNPLHRLHMVPDIETTRVDITMVVQALQILGSSWEVTREWAKEMPACRCVPAALSRLSTILDASDSQEADAEAGD
jgi:hypothetical protein